MRASRSGPRAGSALPGRSIAQASYGLYLRLGFTVYGTEIHAMKIEESYVDEYLMTKFLA